MCIRDSADTGATTTVTASGQQPVWSPDGSRLAWNEASEDGFAIVSVGADFSDRFEAPTPFFGYYGYWDPTSTRLAMLGNAFPGTGLVLDEGVEQPLEVVGADGFYFFSWSPDGLRWVVRGTGGLRIADPSGDGPVIELDLASASVPIWTPDNRIIVAVRSGDGADVVAIDPVSLDQSVLFSTGDITRMVLDPTGRYLAVETIEVLPPGQSGIQEVAFRQQPEFASTILVHDLATSATSEANDGGALAMWWSPSGSHLAMLVPGANSQLRWVWWTHDGTVTAGESHRITPFYASTYLPFYDQFAQSVTPWSSDGQRFAYAGVSASGAGVFVDTIGDDVGPVLVSSTGDVAIWAPG